MSDWLTCPPTQFLARNEPTPDRRPLREIFPTRNGHRVRPSTTCWVCGGTGQVPLPGAGRWVFRVCELCLGTGRQLA